MLGNVNPLAPITVGSGFIVTVNSAIVLINGIPTTIASTVVSLTPAATNYVYVNSSGVVVVNTSGFPVGVLPVSTITCSATSITSIVDSRSDFSLSGSTAATNASVTINIDGAGSVPSTGVHARLSVPVACTVKGWILVADVAGSAVIDVLRSTYAAFPTTASIAGTDKPTLTAVQKNENLGPLTLWGSTALAVGDVLEFNLSSVATCKVLSLTLNVSIP
jgi:hypothetical protein